MTYKCQKNWRWRRGFEPRARRSLIASLEPLSPNADLSTTIRHLCHVSAAAPVTMSVAHMWDDVFDFLPAAQASDSASRPRGEQHHVKLEPDGALKMNAPTALDRFRPAAAA
ncbi:hypothetical protein EVAR_8221_1 [Eumeta japonica]|uniref:Uncharacterized protein n=1 Tax=Eumeta variegata TaxID=151549 RepID=A0A4C1TFP8_EUMVA|nr:hypothetical protein EVAR_8221_1 [Eumeta japonica]